MHPQNSAFGTHKNVAMLISINDLNGFQLRLVLESSFSQISLKG